MLSDDSFSDLKDYFSFDQAKKDKYDTLAKELVCSRLIINNSLSSKTRKYFKEQYVVNQFNYPNMVVNAVAMITSFGNDDVDRGRGNKNTNKIPKAIVSIHLANCGNDYSKPDNDGAVVSFEFTANDRGTTEDNDLPVVEAPAVDSEFRNDNINENVETSDDDDGNDDDNNEAIIMTGNNNDENSRGEGSVSDNNNTYSTTNPTNGNPAWILLLAVADDDDKDDPGDYDEFCSDYDLNDDSVFHNNDADNREEYVCMTVTDSWLPFEEDEYKDDDILLRHGVFDVNVNPSIHPNFSTALSTIALVAHTSTTILFPTPKYFARPCLNPQ